MGPVKRIGTLARTFMTSATRRTADYHEEGGIPGANLPFSIHNRYRLTLNFILFFGSGLAIPFLMVRHQLLKK